MRTSTPPEFLSEVTAADLPFESADAALRADTAARGMDLHEGHGRSVWCEVELGEYGVRKRGEGVLLFARAHQVQDLAAMQQELGRILDLDLHWPSGADEGQFPPAFTLARLDSVTRISESFVRLRLSTDRVERFGHNDSIHFRLVLPPAGIDTPEWPRLNENGQTVWPSGEHALHRPPYTTRSVNLAEGWLETDVFLHAGGRVTEWALAAKPGAVIGIAGPGGSGIPEADHFLLAGDETAYPAIARILEAQTLKPAGQAHGKVWLLGASGDYPFPRPEGFVFAHLPNGSAKLAAEIARETVTEDSFVWMAAERTGISDLRHLILDEMGVDNKRTHISAYWTDPSQAPRPRDRDRNPKDRNPKERGSRAA